ncbi:MAG: protein kinase [Deltaproteobacteria bacterium]|jgi:WD40 repeat protein/serine/threonine protein kinase|nr:protein kinase [Deltaproteobacteria bacterium]MBW2533506.1 protein kinase [Deltaproteobacteria bacterium]
MGTGSKRPGGTDLLGPHATQRIDPLAQTVAPRTRASQPGEQAPACEPGTMVDHFQVIRLIGRGGMGEVYLAYDTDLGRRVALKMVMGEWLSSEEAVERFLFEVRTTAKFNHPNIVTVYAAGKYEGRPYVALEYLPGQNLRQRMEERPPGPQESLRIMLAVVEALEEAHSHGVLHRDLKPENVIIPLDGRLRVVDFGLAKQVRGVRPDMLRPMWDEDTADSEQAEAILSAAEAAASADHRTAPESDQGLKGTPTYMAPEQWLSEECSPATDIWAVGVILFELCARRLPYNHDNISRQLAAVCAPEPAPRVDQFATVPEELATLIARCLDKDASFRPLPAEVAASLRDMLYDTTAAVSGRESPFRGLMPFTERHAGLFFGREAEIAAFVERVRHEPVLPVVGASGAGKSSFVQAGIIPRLREQEPWMVLQLRPGSRPFHALATRLIRGDSWQDRSVDEDSSVGGSRPGRSADGLDSRDLSGAGSEVDPAPDEHVSVDAPTMVSKDTPADRRDDDEATETVDEVAPPSVTARKLSAMGDAIDQLADRLVESPRRLSLRLRSLAEKQAVKVLLFIDQLEELFTLVDDDEIRERFIQALCTAAEDPQDPVRVVFTVRDDFLGRLAVSAEAREALTHVTVVQRLDRAALAQTLRRPVEVAGFQFDDDALVEQMVASVEGEPAGLPLLQFAAQMLWDRRDAKRQRLLRSAYEEIGGVEGALAKHADGVLDGLSPRELKVARELLLRLVTAERTRKVISQAQALHGLQTPAEAGEEDGGRDAERVLDRLTAARLVNVSRVRGDEDTDSVLELAHESLIHTWTTLARWIDEGREELAFVAEVGQAAELWDRRGRRPEELWRGSAVEEALRTASRCTAPLPRLVLDFLTAAKARHRRRQQRIRAAIASAIGVSVAVAIVATLVALFVADKEREAREQRDLAEQREARALEEGARAALGDGRMLEARAKLRAALEKEESASTSARGLWWQLERDPLVWTQELGATIYSVAFSPDGTTVAAGCQDHAVYLMNAETRATRVLRGHEDQVLAVAFSADGAQLATGSWDGRISIWNATTGAKVKTLQDHQSGIRSLAFAPTGSVLAAGNYAGEISLWNTSTGERDRTLAGHAKVVTDLAFDATGARLVSASPDRTVRRWDAASGEQRATCKGHEESVLTVDIDPTGQIVASGSRDRTIRLWDPENCRPLGTLQGHGGDVSTLRFGPEGQLLISGGRDGTLRLWDVRARRQVQVYEGHTSALWSVDFSRDGALLASGSADNTVRIWSARGNDGDSTTSGHSSSVWAVHFSPDGSQLVSASRDGTVRQWNVATAKPERVLVGHSGSVQAAAFSPDGRWIASAGDDRHIRLWETATGKEGHVLAGHAASVRSVAFGPSGALLASSGMDDSVRLWDLRSGDPLHVFVGHEACANSVRFDPAGLLLASAGWDQTVRLWDVRSREAKATIGGHETEVWGVSFSPDGRSIASIGSDGTIRLSAVDGEEQRVLGRHPVRGSDLAFHPDGQQLYSAGSESSAYRWSLDSGAALRLIGHRGDVNAIAVAPTGDLVATGGDDTTVRIWRASDARPFWHAPALLGSPPWLLSHRGWERIGGTADGPGRAPKGADAVPFGRRLREALQTRTRRAAHDEADAVCLQTFEQKVEVWSVAADQAVARPELADVEQVVAVPQACAVRARERAHLVPTSGSSKALDLEGSVTALGWSAGALLAATDRDVQVLSPAGEPQQRHESNAGTITALTGRGLLSHDGSQAPRWLAVGYRDGNIELLVWGADRAAPSYVFEGVPASPPTRMAPGPLNTLIVGYANGMLGLWNLEDGKQLAQARLHGPIVHLMQAGRWQYAATELGEHITWDLGAFGQDHCDLLAEVWKSIPTVWHNGQPMRQPPPSGHRCSGQ